MNRELSINTKQDAMYFECTSNYRIVANTSPLKTMKKIAQTDLYSKLGQMLKQDVVNYSLHVCSPATTVNQAEWFDMVVRPVANKSETTFELTTVFRKREKPVIAEFLNNIEEKIKGIFRILEA